MFTILLLTMVGILLAVGRTDLRSPLDRMSLAFQVENKPYPGLPKPKDKGKGKGKDHRLLMAIAKFSGIGPVAMSGKVNGTVFMRNNVIRVWAHPRNVLNTFTQYVRGILAGVSAAFKTLTSAQVDAWNVSAANWFRNNAFGDSKALSGIQFFQRINNILISLGITPVTDPPLIAATSYIIVGAATTADVSAQSVETILTDFSGAAVVLPADTYLRVFATSQRPVSQSSFGKSDYRYIGFYPPTTSTNPLVISADYIAKFGAITLNAKIGVYVEVVTVLGAGAAVHISGKFYSTAIAVA